MFDDVFLKHVCPFGNTAVCHRGGLLRECESPTELLGWKGIFKLIPQNYLSYVYDKLSLGCILLSN